MNLRIPDKFQPAMNMLFVQTLFFGLAIGVYWLDGAYTSRMYIVGVSPLIMGFMYILYRLPEKSQDVSNS